MTAFLFDGDYALEIYDAIQRGDTLAAPKTWDQLLTMSVVAARLAEELGGPDCSLQERVLQANDEQAEAIVEGSELAVRGIMNFQRWAFSALVYERRFGSQAAEPLPRVIAGVTDPGKEKMLSCWLVDIDESDRSALSAWRPPES